MKQENLKDQMIEQNQKSAKPIPEFSQAIANTDNPKAVVVSIEKSEEVPQRLIRCPDCNSILQIQYSCNQTTCLWSIFLLIGLTCWVPCVIDGCKKSVSTCLTCDKVVQEYNPACC